MNEFINFAREWKELVGALIGGVFSLLVALLVASQARRAEEKSSATLLVAEFLRIHAMVKAAKNTGVDLSEEKGRQLFVERLCHYRVRLNPLFESAIARVLPVDIHLASTMTLASSLIRDTEPIIERLLGDIEFLQSGCEPRRSDDLIQQEITTISKHYEIGRAHV